MKKEYHEALSSLLEIAAFAWSVLEVLLTRVLPLAGFLIGQFLLQFCRLLASFVRGAGRRRFNLSHQNIAQSEDQFVEEEKWLQVEAYGDQTDDSEMLKLADYGEKVEGRQLTATAAEEDSIILPSLGDNSSVNVLQTEAAVLPAVDALPVYQYEDDDNTEPLQEEKIESKYASDAAVKKVQSWGDDQAQVGKKEAVEAAAATEDVQMELGDNQLAHASEEAYSFDTAASDQMQVKPDNIDQGQGVVVISEKEGLDLDGNELPGIIAGGVDQQLQRSNASGSSVEAVSAPAAAEISMVGPFNSTAGGADQQQQMMRRSRRRGRRVLPPSLSQIKRTIKQMSGRPSTTSPSPPAEAAGSELSSRGPATPSPLKKKLNGSPRDRKLASSGMKHSPSYETFLRKFRKHFLLDRA